MVISDYSAAFFSRDKNDSNNSNNFSSNALCTRQPWWQLSSSSSSSRVYLFPLITIISTALYGNLLIVCYESAEFSAEDNSNKCNLTVAFLQRSPVVMLHQMLPQVMWSQMDVVYSLGILTVVINYATFLKQPYTAGRYELVKTRRKASSSTSSISVLSISGKELSAKLSATIISSYRLLYKWVTRFLQLTFSFIVLFGYFNAFFVNAHFSWASPLVLALWLVVFPLHIFYLFYGFFAVPSAVILATEIISLRQRYLLRKFSSLCCLKQQKSFAIQKFSWARYLGLQRQLASLAVDIKRCSDFWTANLSAYFFGFLLIQAYQAYTVLFSADLPPVSQIFFTYILIATETFQYLLIHQCAKVASGNGRLERVNARFYSLHFCVGFVHFPGQVTAFKRRQTDKRVILKAAAFQAFQRLRPYALHLLDDYRITSKTFYLVLIYSVLFFMMVFKRQNE